VLAPAETLPHAAGQVPDTDPYRSAESPKASRTKNETTLWERRAGEAGLACMLAAVVSAVEA
jgi:hypothetical protein